MRAILLLTIILGTPVTALADPQNGVRVSIERHFTTDALDSPAPRADSYTRATGSFRYFRAIEDGHVGISGEVAASRHDAVRIEDDRVAGLAVEAKRRVTERLELRGALSAAVLDEGDDLPLGPLVLGMRTRTLTLTATAQAGYDLGGGTTLAVEAVAGSERSGRTRFEGDLIGPVKLEPDRRRLKAGGRLAHDFGDASAALALSAGRTWVETIGLPPVALGFDEAGVLAELVRVWPGGARALLSIGIHGLAARGGGYNVVRPVWRAELSGPLRPGLELRGAFLAAFETADTDDPLASYLIRGEVELGYRPAEQLTLAVGAFVEGKRNLLLENREDIAGGYGEAVYALSPTLSLVVRADYRRSVTTILAIERRRLDGFVGLRARM